MIFPMVAMQMPTLGEAFRSVCSLGFLMGVVCTCLVLFVCWAVWSIFRHRRKNMVFRVMQNDGGELVLTYKAVKTHIRLKLAREYPSLTLKGMDFSGASVKSLRLRMAAEEGVNLGELRNALCERLLNSFQRELGLADTVKSINIDIEEFREKHDGPQPSELVSSESSKSVLEVPVLKEDVSPLPKEEKASEADGGDKEKCGEEPAGD